MHFYAWFWYHHFYRPLSANFYIGSWLGNHWVFKLCAGRFHPPTLIHGDFLDAVPIHIHPLSTLIEHSLPWIDSLEICYPLL
ncbi:hypothetical protein M5K25_007563 [Dendrobium thyrsiflorum]|uniref:Uncharacterized protein n=1 Tax=Dendrobium thyrsiflorum TaxID=117978 RepID=A0ABD0VEQ0_DENTH